MIGTERVKISLMKGTLELEEILAVQQNFEQTCQVGIPPCVNQQIFLANFVLFFVYFNSVYIFFTFLKKIQQMLLL